MKDNRIHVAHIIYSFSIGGLENGIVNLINTLGSDDYRHSIICLSDYDPEFAKRIQTDNVDYYALHKREGNDFGMLWRLLRLLLKIRPDVTHSRNFVAMETQFLALLAGIRLRVHGEHGWDTEDLDGLNQKYRRLRAIMSHFVHKIVCLSEHGERYLVDDVGIPAKKIVHIYNGVDLSRYSPNNRSLGTDENKTVVFGTVGRLDDVKNQALLIEAYSTLLKMDASYLERTKLMIVGGGKNADSLQALVNDRGITGNVTFTGPRHDVPEMMAQMDVFVLPSLAEGISNTILEAMASGLPVIATDVGGNSELLASNCGVLVSRDNPRPMADAMQRYVDYPSERIGHGEAARPRAEQKFSIDSMVSAYHRIYQTVKGS